MPAIVTAVDMGSLRVSVQPVLSRPVATDDGEAEIVALPEIYDVPIVMLGSGGVRVRFDVSVGDSGWVSFADGAIDRWLTRGDLEYSGDERSHSLSDAVFFPGLQSFAQAGDATETIEFSGGEILIGGGAEPTFMADAYGAAFSTLISAIATAAAGTGAGVTTAISSALSAFNSTPGKQTTITKVS
jgi:hypothetical protein